MSARLRHRVAFPAAFVVCVLLMGSALAAADRGSARFIGKTDQGYSLHFTLDGNQVDLIRVKVKLRCRNGGLLYDDLSDFEPAALRPNGRFNDLQFGSTDEVHWRGSLKGAKARGSIRVKDKLKSGVRCDSGNVGFVARSARK
jgi:hypothetical protein